MENNSPLLFIIPEGIENMRVDKAIALETHLSRSVIADLFDNHKVWVNGEIVKRSHKVIEDDEIEVIFSEVSPEGIVPQDIPIDVIYEDNDLLVINKQANLVVHPGAGNPDGTLVNGLVYLYPDIIRVGQTHRPGIVHRLDATTSGLVVVAKTQEAYENFVDKFSRHEVEREYYALVWGEFSMITGMIEGAIGRSVRPTKMALRADGKNARTHYRVSKYFKDMDVSLIDISLETGRTHQIRVHFSSINHPIVGDRTYGGYRQSLECPRPFLHAHTLRFIHPSTSKPMEFHSQLPDDLNSVLSSLR